MNVTKLLKILQYIIVLMNFVMKKNSKIYIAGHNGMVGSSLKRKFEGEGYKNII